jgi:hypothetical protein
MVSFMLWNPPHGFGNIFTNKLFQIDIDFPLAKEEKKDTGFPKNRRFKFLLDP